MTLATGGANISVPRQKSHFFFNICSIGVFFDKNFENRKFDRLGVSKREGLSKYRLGIVLSEKRELDIGLVPKSKIWL